MRRLLMFALAAVSVLAALILVPRIGSIPPVSVTPTPVTPTPTGTPTGPLTFTIRPVRDAVNADGDALDVVMEITAPRGKEDVRSPVDFALVLDRSGSMEGEPLANALEAARKLLGRLDADDRLAIIEFGSDVRLTMPLRSVDGAGRELAEKALRGISSDGGTNLGDAISVAHQALKEASVQPGRVRRIVLLSDGQANEGPVGPALVQLARTANADGLRVSALGLGSDFDEDQMLAIADAGGGQYRYLQNDDALAAALNTELRQAGTTAATRVQLHLRNTDAALQNVFGYQAAAIKGGHTISLADLAAGETRRIVARFQVPAGALGLRSIVDAQLSYATPESPEKTLVSEADAKVTATRSEREVAQSWKKEAAEAGIKAKWGAVMFDSADVYAKKDAEESRAVRSRGLAALLDEAKAAGVANVADALNAENAEADLQFAAPNASAEGRAAAKSFKSRGLAAAR